MIPLIDNFICGYDLVSDFGDIYCYGETNFYGTIKEVFGETTNIVAGLAIENGLNLISSDGKVFTLANNAEMKVIPNATDVVDANLIDDNIVVLNKNGFVLNQEGERIQDFESTSSEFLAFSIASNARDLYLLDTQNRVHCSNGAQHYGDLTTLDVNDARAIDIACSPWGNGYWMIDQIGGVFCFGEVDYFGSVPGDGRNCKASKIIPTPTGYGYWILDKRGMILPFGDASYFGNPKPGTVTGNLIDVAIRTKPGRGDEDWLFTKLVNNDIDQLLGNPLASFDEPIAD